MRFAIALVALVQLTGCGALHRSKCVAAISDLHLGDPRSILDDAAGREVLASSIRGLVENGGVRTLVLNGDVLELSLASEESAYRAARDLFAELAKIEKLERVVVVVGNHDHRLFEDLPGTNVEKLGRSFTESALHDAIADVKGALEVSVVYPGWSLPVKNGTVHFTHGHYFDPWTTPSFSDAQSWEHLEDRNETWTALVTAGGEDRLVRAAYRGIYHWSHHVSGALGSVLGEGAVELSDRDTDRLRHYVRYILRDPTTVALVQGHTHQNGGLEQRIFVGDRDVDVYDTGAFVVGHHGRAMRPYVFLVDPKRGDRKLVPIVVPPDVEQAAMDRAFATVP